MNKTCVMCGDTFDGQGEYCPSCADYIRQNYEQVEREAYDNEARKDEYYE